MPGNATPSSKVVISAGRVTFWDARDTVMVKLIPIDVGKLQQRPGDSLVYLHDAFPDALQGGKDVGGYLLHRASSLKRPLTVVSNSRIYAWGGL